MTVYTQGETAVHTGVHGSPEMDRFLSALLRTCYELLRMPGNTGGVARSVFLGSVDSWGLLHHTTIEDGKANQSR